MVKRVHREREQARRVRRSKINPSMSALGQKQTLRNVRVVYLL
jgi:hypothetical protein